MSCYCTVKAYRKALTESENTARCTSRSSIPLPQNRVPLLRLAVLRRDYHNKTTGTIKLVAGFGTPFYPVRNEKVFAQVIPDLMKWLPNGDAAFYFLKEGGKMINDTILKPEALMKDFAMLSTSANAPFNLIPPYLHTVGKPFNLVTSRPCRPRVVAVTHFSMQRINTKHNDMKY